MKNLFSLLYIILFSYSLSAQIQWLEVTSTKDGKSHLNDRMSAQKLTESDDTHLINYNPSISISKAMELDIPNGNLGQCNIFTIYQPTLHSSEELIWQISHHQKDQLLLTNNRIADLLQGKFINFVSNDPFQAQINSYHHYQNSFATDKIIFGGIPSNIEIPVRKFNGHLAELIVFNHKLAPLAQQVIEGHLALKYSIPLHPGLDYLDKKGKTIWEYKKNTTFSFNMAGIGRNDELNFHQKQSQSRFGDGHIAFGTQEIAPLNIKNPASLHENEYLLWADNDAIIDFEETYNDVYQLERSWQATTNRYISDHRLAFELEHSGLEKSLHSSEQFWLLTSQNQLDKVDLESASLYPLIQENNAFITQNINTQNLNYFTILKAPKLWLHTELNNPTCGSNNEGSILVKPVGGEAPYTIRLQDKNGNTIEEIRKKDNHIHEFQNLNTDQYMLSIIDAKNLSWKTDVYLNSSGLPSLDLPSKVLLSNDEKISFEPELNIDQVVDFTWTLPDDQTINTQKIEISAPGRYQLLAEIKDCKLWHHIEVIQEENNIANTNIYPNPTTNGYFTFSAELKEPTPYSISISDATGQILKEEAFDVTKYISFSDWIGRDGMYFITLTSNHSIKTEKLVVITN